MPNPHRHEFHVGITIRDTDSAYVDFVLPKWNPGAYRLSEAHRHIRGVKAESESGKSSYPVQKLDEIRWRVHHQGKPFRLMYRVYADEYNGIDGAFLDDATGFFNGVYVFMYIDGQKERSINLQIDPLPKKSVTTGLNRRGRYYRAKDYDELVDMPVRIGRDDQISFKLGSVPIRIAIAGKGNYDREKIRSDFKKICQQTVAVFGEISDSIPFEHYTFMLSLGMHRMAGLEHRNSSVIAVEPWIFNDPREYSAFLNVVAHEFFHAWNVKRIRPNSLGPFAYDREVHTRMLWFSEGITSYYAWIILARAGLASERQTLRQIQNYYRQIEESPIRESMSVEQSSWDTWLPPKDRHNSYYSYYTKGALVGVVLDLQLRYSSNNKKSLDSVFQLLWSEYKKSGTGFSPTSLARTLVEHAKTGGDRIRGILDDYVYGVKPMKLATYLRYAGYKLEITGGDSRTYLGVRFDLSASEDGSIRIDSVRPGSAADLAGLAGGDRIVAIDEQKVQKNKISQQLVALKSGRRYWFTLFRGQRLIRVRVKLGARSSQVYRIIPMERASVRQLRIRKSWLGRGNTDAGKPSSKRSVRATSASL